MHDLIFFTGAGISAESGIPTFQDQGDLRDKLSRDYALRYAQEFKEVIRDMCEVCSKAKPNAAHYAIAALNCPVITMNIDTLHQQAGTKNVIAVHGRLPEPHELQADNYSKLMNIPVLYGDPAPNYAKAFRLVENLERGKSTFVIVGSSNSVCFSSDLEKIARQRNADIIRINANAATEVPILCEKLKKRYTT